MGGVDVFVDRGLSQCLGCGACHNTVALSASLVLLSSVSSASSLGQLLQDSVKTQWTFYRPTSQEFGASGKATTLDQVRLCGSAVSRPQIVPSPSRQSRAAFHCIGADKQSYWIIVNYGPWPSRRRNNVHRWSSPRLYQQTTEARGAISGRGRHVLSIASARAFGSGSIVTSLGTSGPQNIDVLPPHTKAITRVQSDSSST